METHLSDSEHTSDAPPYGEMIVDDVAFPCLRTADYDNLAIFLRKTTLGDPSLDNEEYLSSVVWSDLSGGAMIDKHTAATVQKFGYGIVTHWSPNKIALPPKVDTFTFTDAGTAMPHGDYPKRQTLLFSFGTSLRAFVPGATLDAGSYDEIATLNAPAYAPGTVYKGRLYLPQGSDGYDIWDGATVTPGESGITPIGFWSFDGQLWAFEHDGQVSYTIATDDDGGPWQSPSQFLLTDETPRRIHQYRNTAGEECIVLVTDEAVWMVDPYTPKLWRSKLFWPNHENFGHGAAVYPQAADLWVPQGLGLTRYNNEFQAPGVGLDKDHGLPHELRGFICDLIFEGRNFLVALVSGAVTEEDVPDEWYASSGRGRTIPPTFAGQAAISSLHFWNGRGFGQMWQSAAPTHCSRLAMSSAGGTFRLVWGTDGTANHMDLDINFLNPEEAWHAGSQRWAPTGFFVTGRWYGGTEGIDKLVSHIVTSALNATATETITVGYGTDRHDLLTIGTMTRKGRVSMRLGIDPTVPDSFNGDGQYFSRGERFDWIRLRTDFARADDTYADQFKTPILDANVLKYMKFQTPTRSYNLSIQIPPGGYGGKSAQYLLDFIDNRIKPYELYPIRLFTGQRALRARLTSLRGRDVIGASGEATRDIVVLDILDGRESELIVG